MTKDSKDSRPSASSKEAEARMKRQRQRDTKPELEVRCRVHALGLRYRVDVQPVAGVRKRGDLVFTKAHVAVFIDGCFWHGCPKHGTWPKSNEDWWREKIDRNRQRDQDTDHLLSQAGWRVIRAWEHDDADAVAGLIAQAVQESKDKNAPPLKIHI